MFNWKDIKSRGKGLTFDDVLIIPARSDIRSRRDPQLTSKLTKKITIETPIISANMDTVTEYDMAFAMHQLGGIGILHRFITTEEQALQARRLKEAGVKHVSASVGVGEEFKARAKTLIDGGVDIITIDIAHGHSIQMMETLKWLKDHYPNIEIIAGNLATPDAARDLIEAGADAIKVGIGPGSMCTTRIITGAGVPQLTAIGLCAEVADSYGVPVIADGGIRTSGDMVKAFAAGASTVMLGSMLAGTIESPGEIKNGKKQYRGMASRSAQESWRGGVPQGMAPEGEATQVNVKGHVKDVILEVTGGIRSGMSYVNANSIAEIREKALFMEMSANGIAESRAHGVK
ncbi:guanosine monophosphate reductase [Bdellovibrio bacteriovorus]|uniref:Guanosine monophosphate reductase n=2 Tax=Bdellovibrio bacteriovorus TaxID=959 RepID=A0A150WK66_BDEBC|nr:guanosine monophosphate reductase [Bdellovibrio bacteriovorus]